MVMQSNIESKYICNQTHQKLATNEDEENLETIG
jgi:hypothetical protein